MGPETHQATTVDDVAVVGIGLRFPGEATSPEKLWKILERGESQWSEFPADRLNIDGYFHPSGCRQGSISFRGAHFLKENVAAFDAPFFSVSADDANAIDPQQRLLLEIAYEALENAGIPKEDVDGSDTSVFVGSFVKDYEQICLRDPDYQPQYAATGNGIAIMANRISYAFNLHGPSMTIDTGCSGSLVSIHLAVQSLKNGESSLALAAGAGMILTPNTIMPMTALNFLSPDGKCFTFDSRANGYGRGEGVGVVVLKRLSDALRDNDTIRAVIRGSRVNQDGRTTGITLPSKEAQVANIRSLYKSIGLSYDQTGYVECHGTGTQAGDWRELKAISETLASIRSVESPLIVGSIKPNIGHLEGAAGVAGLIKGVLALEHGIVPPNIHFETGNPDIDFLNWKVKVPQRPMAWPLSGVRRVSINCFGFGGTNAHVVMDEAPAYLEARNKKGHHNTFQTQPGHEGRTSSDSSPARSHLFCFSSTEKLGLRRLMHSYLKYLQSSETMLKSDGDFLTNLSYTLGCRRSNLEWKGVIIADSAGDLGHQLKSAGQGSFTRSSPDKAPPICFVFCGQGSQWAAMGKDLIGFKAFRDSVEAASYYMSIYLGSRFNLLEQLFTTGSDSRISDPEVSQPATTALQVALVDLLSALSIKPSCVVGHSSGEIAAAYASGFITREMAWEIAYWRGAAAASLLHRAPKLQGRMMAVGMSPEEAQAYVRAYPGASRGHVQVACLNSPRSVTLSGHADDISSVARGLSDKGIVNKVLAVKTAYHSEHMRLVEHAYKEHLAHVGTGKHRPRVAMFSSLTGRAIRGDDLEAGYWVDNMVSPVNYLGAVREMLKLPVERRPRIFVEIGPHPTLRTPTMDILTRDGHSPIPNSTMMSVLERNKSGEATLLQAVGDLWARGCVVDVKYAFTRGSDQTPRCLVDLPSYPWNHDRTYWHESHLGEATRFRKYPRQDLIGAPTADSIPFQPRWRGFLRLSENPWIQDHRVQKTIIYPAAGMVTMVLEAAKQLLSSGDASSGLSGYEITNMKIERAMIIPTTAHGLETALNMNIIGRDAKWADGESPQADSAEFSIYSKQLEAPWERHASGLLTFQYHASGGGGGNFLLAALGKYTAEYPTASASCTAVMAPRQLYEQLDTVGMSYGPAFQNIVDIRKGRASCVSKIRIPDTRSRMPAQYEYPHLLHPATLDSMFQTLFAIEPVPMVPTYIESLFVSADVASHGEGHDGCFFSGLSTVSRYGPRGAKADITMKLGETQSHIVVRGLVLTGLGGPGSDQEGGFLPNHRNLCTEIVWKEDVTFGRNYPVPLLDFVALWTHKYPGVSILRVGGANSLSLAILDLLAPTKGAASRLARLGVVVPDLDASVAEQILRLSALTPLAHTVTVVHGGMVGPEPAVPEFDLVLVDGETVFDSSQLRKHLKVAGRILRIRGQGTAATVEPWDDGERVTSPPSVAKLDAIVLLHPDVCSPQVKRLMNWLPKVSARKGPNDVKFVAISSRQLAANPEAVSGKNVVSLLDLDGEGGMHGGFVYAWGKSDFNLFHTMQRMAKGILWLTQGAQMECPNPKAAPIIALARTLMSEDSFKTVTTLDLDAADWAADMRHICPMVLSVLSRTFVESTRGLVREVREVEYAMRDGKIFIPRLDLVRSLNALIERGEQVSLGEADFCTDDASPTVLSVAPTLREFADDGVPFVESVRGDIGAQEVEIAFERITLSFTDLADALEHTVEAGVGRDVVGRVVRFGRDVSGLQVGNRVMALVGGRGALQSFVVADCRLVTAFHPGIVASSLVSAYFGLIHIGRVARDRTVLVHAGATEAGFTAIQLCYAHRARVYTTVMGTHTASQRQMLEKAGMPSHHIIEASSESFARSVLELTGGRGVDVVYNPTQEHVECSATCVRQYGVIVQFAHRSASPRVSRGGVAYGTYVNWDLAQMIVEDTGFVADLFRRSMRLCRILIDPFSGLLLPFSLVVGVGQVGLALRHIEQAPYLYHAAVVCAAAGTGTGRGRGRGTGTGITCTVPVLRVYNDASAAISLQAAVDPSGTYLLAGGLGGLGRSICELLVSHGARNIALLSRSGASPALRAGFLADLAGRGVTVRVYRVDISVKDELKGVIEGAMARELPRICGVFQCAAVISDSIFDNMTFDVWTAAARPKMSGSWNLVEAVTAAAAAAATSQDPFFIFLSSSSGVIGNRSQANYAAGNCFEDALARHLRAQGRHAVSIDLGPVLGAGMLAEDEGMLATLLRSGFYGIRHQDFLKVVEHAITMEAAPGVPMPAQVALGVGTGGLLRQNQPADPYWSRTALYSYLKLVDLPAAGSYALSSQPQVLQHQEQQPPPARQVDLKDTLAGCMDAQSAAGVVCDGLLQMLAKAINLAPEEMDADRPLNAYGVDSLVAVGVRNWVQGTTGVEVSVFEVLSDTTISELAVVIAERGAFGADK